MSRSHRPPLRDYSGLIDRRCETASVGQLQFVHIGAAEAVGKSLSCSINSFAPFELALNRSRCWDNSRVHRRMRTAFGTWHSSEIPANTAAQPAGGD